MALKHSYPQYTRRSIFAATAVEDNELLTVQQGMEIGDSIAGYCLDAPTALPRGGAARINGYLVTLTSR